MKKKQGMKKKTAALDFQNIIQKCCKFIIKFVYKRDYKQDSFCHVK